MGGGGLDGSMVPGGGRSERVAAHTTPPHHPHGSVPAFLEQQGLGVYESLFTAAGYTGPSCAAELGSMELDQLRLLCRSLERRGGFDDEDQAGGAGTEATARRLDEAGCAALAAQLAVRGRRVPAVLRTLSSSLSESNP